MKKWNISRDPLQGRLLLLPWITWAGVKCQPSGLLREAGTGLEKPLLWPFREPRELTGNWRVGAGGYRAMPAPWWAFQLLRYHLSLHFFLALAFDCQAHSNCTDRIVFIPSRGLDLNTETCCPNVIKRKYLSQFQMLTPSARVYMRITNSGTIGQHWKSHDEPSGPAGPQIQINSVVFSYFDPR